MNGSLPRRYARALIEIGREENLIDRFHEEIASLAGIFRAAPETFEILKNDLFSHTERLSAIGEIADKAGVHPLLKSFLLLLLKKDRFFLFPDIFFEYERYRDEIKGILRIKVVTPKTPDPSLLQHIEKILSERFRKQVISSGEARPEIIGGLILKINHTMYDGSIRRELDHIRENLMRG